MSKLVRPLSIVLSICLSLMISGCGLQGLLGNKDKTSSVKKGEKETIIAVSLDEEDPNKLLITKGIDDLAKAEKVKVKYMDQTESGKEGGGESPLKGAKVLIYQGGDESLLKSAEDDEIPVLALSELPTGVKLVGIITPDQEKAGELMAQALVSKVSEGQIVILQGDPNETGFQERLAGNKAVLSKYPKIEIQTIANTPGSELAAKQSLLDFLQKNSDKVRGVLAHTEKLAALADSVLKQAQLDKKIHLIGGQANVLSLERMTSGTQVSDIDTSPYLLGANAYQWAHKVIKKETLDVNDSITSEQGEIPAKIIQVKAVTPDNIGLIQKSYTKTLESAEKEEKEKEEKDKKEGQSSQGGDQEDSKEEEGKSGDKQESGGEGEQSGKSAMPPGVKKVTERIKTETIREYLDDQGKVIGTEKTANEQVKSVPPEMLKKQEEQPKEEKKGQGGESEEGKSE